MNETIKLEEVALPAEAQVQATPEMSLSGQAFFRRQTEWLQETRLMAEAIYRLRLQRKTETFLRFLPRAWPKKNLDPNVSNFIMSQQQIDLQLKGLLPRMLESRFIFLETLWEAYLSDLVVELSHESGSFFEEALKDTSIPSELVRRALTDKYSTIEELQRDIGVVFAERTTRSSFREQWKRLAQLVKALGKTDPSDQWFHDLEVYFCMRNCVIHRQCLVSVQLAEASEAFKDKGGQRFQISPSDLDYFRHSFIACITHIETKLQAFFAAKAQEQQNQNGTQ
jgi:hypothetical protein